MKSLWFPIAVLCVVLIAGAVLLILPGKSQAPAAPATDPHADIITADSPKPGEAISSTTLTVTGKARGSWYFEASFPVLLKDTAGHIIAQGPAKAQGDWMTTDFVPFSITLTYPIQSSGSAGTVVLKKDNPSGDPAKDDSLEIPITFQ